MRILITNSTFALRGGTEAYTQDLTVALRRAGHEVVAYSPILGQAAIGLREAGAHVIDDLADAPWNPDILHCHHNTEAMTALLHFPVAPAIFVSHGWTGWPDAPVRHPRVLRYVAVDAPTRDALINTHGIPEERIWLIPNFVDLERFVTRDPLPAACSRALVLSHYAREDTHVPVVQEACRRRGLTLDVVGYGVGRPVQSPERILGSYDLVFAKGRAALEAVASGNAVIVCDSFGIGPMVTSENVRVLRTLDGDFMQWYAPLGVDALLRQIDRYDSADAAKVTAWIRSVAGGDLVVREFADLYRSAQTELASNGIDATADARAAAAYLKWLSTLIKEQLVERDPLAGLAVRLRNRLTRVPFLAPLLLRMSARLQRRWAARSSPRHGQTVERPHRHRVPPPG